MAGLNALMPPAGADGALATAGAADATGDATEGAAEDAAGDATGETAGAAATGGFASAACNRRSSDSMRAS